VEAEDITLMNVSDPRSSALDVVKRDICFAIVPISLLEEESLEEVVRTGVGILEERSGREISLMES
jgi:hypothetical protein